MKFAHLALVPAITASALILTACSSGDTSDSTVDAPAASVPASAATPSPDIATSPDGQTAEPANGALTPDTSQQAEDTTIMNNAPIEEVAQEYADRYAGFAADMTATGKAIRSETIGTNKAAGEFTAVATLNPDGSAIIESTATQDGEKQVGYGHCPTADKCFMSLDNGETWTPEPGLVEEVQKGSLLVSPEAITSMFDEGTGYGFVNDTQTIYEFQGSVRGQYTRLTIEFIGSDKALYTASDPSSTIVSTITLTDPVPVPAH